ncbi:MAG: hypothetical protein R3200_03565 [Xanthomonadales bacterium]|nr:hypothetical protein [Xanthomonadales bacterium]
MRWLVRTITRKKKGAVAHSDDTFLGEVLTIGRGAGQGVFLTDLRVALEHARVVPTKGNRFRVESLIAAGVRVDGKLQSAAGAGVGSKIEVGGYQIQIMKPPQGFDAAVQVSELEGDDGERQAHVSREHQDSLKNTFLAKRGPSWLLFLAFLAIGLIVPAIGYLVPGLQQQLRSIPGAPSDSQWEAGSLQTAHHFFGENCELCHSQAFTRVQDKDCIACHVMTPVHAEPEFFDLPALTETSCSICHRDHNGPTGLINARQDLCTDCHGNLDERTNGTTVLANVTDFTDSHPQFKVELAGWDPAGNYLPRRESLENAPLVEDSNLKFPHDTHLNPEGINAPDGTRVLGCADCHRPEPGGSKMMPVAFETMCQDCHKLGFDPNAPDRQVPHGDAPEVLFTLEEYYTNKALRGGVEDASAPPAVRARRRPGERVSRADRLEILAWANEQSRRIGQTLFEGQACGVCHTVQRVQAEQDISWRVEPVRVAGVWFGSALFTHDSHTTMDCESCHEAQQSHVSDDVLIPGIENCRQCHGGEHDDDKVASPCIDCHKYHDHPLNMMAGSN